MRKELKTTKQKMESIGSIPGNIEKHLDVCEKNGKLCVEGPAEVIDQISRAMREQPSSTANKTRSQQTETAQQSAEQ